MTLIGILLALMAERAFGHLPSVGEPMLLQRVLVGAQRLIPIPGYWRSAAAPPVLLVLATGAVALVDWGIRPPLPDLAFEVLVLFLCLGPRNLSNDIHRLIEARARGDEAAERTLTRVLLRGPGRRATRRTLIGALFIQSHERLFGVLLWFFVAGPAGAVLYRVASRLPRFLHETQPDTPAENVAVALHAAAAWIPSRLTAALLGLAGSLDAAIREWRSVYRTQRLGWRERTWVVLAEVSAATLVEESTETGELLPATLDECLREVLAVQNRALLVLLAAFGLFTAGGMIA